MLARACPYVSWKWTPIRCGGSPAASSACEEPVDVSGRPDADGVAERELVAAEVHEPARGVDDLTDRHLALPGVAEAHRDVGPDPQAGRPGPLDDGTEHRHRLLERAAEVLLGERLGGAAEDGDGADPRLERPVQPPLVGDEDGTVPAEALGPEEAEHVGGVGQLGHPSGVDERGRLDRREAGGREPADELGLDLRRHDRRLVLQPVARAHLVDPHGAGQRRVRFDLRLRHAHPTILTRPAPDDPVRAPGTPARR